MPPVEADPVYLACITCAARARKNGESACQHVRLQAASSTPRASPEVKVAALRTRCTRRAGQKDFARRASPDLVTDLVASWAGPPARAPSAAAQLEQRTLPTSRAPASQPHLFPLDPSVGEPRETHGFLIWFPQWAFIFVKKFLSNFSGEHGFHEEGWENPSGGT